MYSSSIPIESAVIKFEEKCKRLSNIRNELFEISSYDEFKKVRNNLVQQLLDYENEFRHINVCLKTLLVNNKELRLSIEALEDQINGIEQKNNVLVVQNKDYNEKYNQIAKDITSLASNNKNKDLRMIESQEKNDILENRINELERLLNNYENDNENLKRRIDILKRENNILKAENKLNSLSASKSKQYDERANYYYGYPMGDRHINSQNSNLSNKALRERELSYEESENNFHYNYVYNSKSDYKVSTVAQDREVSPDIINSNIAIENRLSPTKQMHLADKTLIEHKEEKPVKDTVKTEEKNDTVEKNIKSEAKLDRASIISELVLKIFASKDLTDQLRNKLGNDFIPKLISNDVNNDFIHKIEKYIEEFIHKTSNNNNLFSNSKNYHSQHRALNNNSNLSNSGKNSHNISLVKKDQLTSYTEMVPSKKKFFNNYTKTSGSFFDPKILTESVHYRTDSRENHHLRYTRLDNNYETKQYHYREFPKGWKSLKDFFNYQDSPKISRSPDKITTNQEII